MPEESKVAKTSRLRSGLAKNSVRHATMSGRQKADSFVKIATAWSNNPTPSQIRWPDAANRSTAIKQSSARKVAIKSNRASTQATASAVQPFSVKRSAPIRLAKRLEPSLRHRTKVRHPHPVWSAKLIACQRTASVPARDNSTRIGQSQTAGRKGLAGVRHGQ